MSDIVRILLALLTAACLAPFALSQRATSPATPASPTAVAPSWQLRSEHFIWGMPAATDDRHLMTGKSGQPMPGISVLVREGFVVGHYDRFKVPAWIAQHWTTEDYRASEAETAKERDFVPDPELPNYARAEKNYDFKTSDMERGHMARQEDNKAWGADNVAMGCRMSNIVPQHKDMNGEAWNDVEDEHRSVVANPASGITSIWVISGPVFRRPGEAEDRPERLVGNGVGVPWATYKVVGWFDRQNRFNARGYLVRQTDRQRGARHYLVTVDEVERLIGLDFFAELDDAIEEKLEAARPTELWK